MNKTTGQKKVRYTEVFQRTVIEEYLRAGCTQQSLEQKYGIGKKGVIRQWMRKLEYEDIGVKVPSLCIPTIESLTTRKTTSGPASTVEALEKRIKELERRLEDEQLRSEGFSRMIDYAEKELNIPIRKKPGTK